VNTASAPTTDEASLSARETVRALYAYVRPHRWAGQLCVSAAGLHEFAQVGQGGLRSQLGGVAAGGAQQRDHGAQFVECGDAQRTNGAGSLFGVRVLGGDLQGSGPHGDQADLVGDHVVHLTGQLGTFAGEHGLRVQGPRVFPGLLDLDQPPRQVPLRLQELAEEDGGGGGRQAVDEDDRRHGPVGIGQGPRSAAREGGQGGAHREETAVAGAFGQSEQRREHSHGYVRISAMGR
jgi:hypothetical protein